MKRSGQGRDWEQRYQEQDVESMPWFHPKLDHDLEEALKTLGIKSSSVLDLGTGPGTQAIALAKKGFQVTASDISKTAIDEARSRSLKDGVDVRFLQDDILTTRLEEEFDLVFDRGCFHVLPPDKRQQYVGAVHGLLKTEGFLFLKCFSHLEPGQEGPHRFSPEQIRELFQSSFTVHTMKESEFLGTIRPLPRALFCVLRKS